MPQEEKNTITMFKNLYFFFYFILFFKFFKILKLEGNFVSQMYMKNNRLLTAAGPLPLCLPLRDRKKKKNRILIKLLSNSPSTVKNKINKDLT